MSPPGLKARMFPNGTRVLCNKRYTGVVDGITTDQKYIIVFDTPVEFPTLGIKIPVGSFCPSLVEEITNET